MQFQICVWVIAHNNTLKAKNQCFLIFFFCEKGDLTNFFALFCGHCVSKIYIFREKFYLMNQKDFGLAVRQPWVVRNDVRIMALKILIWNG